MLMGERCVKVVEKVFYTVCVADITGVGILEVESGASQYVTCLGVLTWQIRQLDVNRLSTGQQKKADFVPLLLQTSN